jgi:hypothetical protein
MGPNSIFWNLSNFVIIIINIIIIFSSNPHKLAVNSSFISNSRLSQRSIDNLPSSLDQNERAGAHGYSCNLIQDSLLILPDAPFMALHDRFHKIRREVMGHKTIQTNQPKITSVWALYFLVVYVPEQVSTYKNVA